MLLVVGYMPSTLLVKPGNGVYGAVITAKPYTIGLVVIFSVHSVLPNLYAIRLLPRPLVGCQTPDVSVALLNQKFDIYFTAPQTVV